ncbi:MAG: preprotein translocase subunit YajC [Nocardioidaceae bacterium]|nr:preprotein translocase subunit YajC [Nocardioidaceae bacterium]
MKELAPWLWIAAIAAIFWVLIIRPASKRQKEAVALQDSLEVGDDVVLTSGIVGTIVGLADDGLDLEVAPGVAIRVIRGAVGSVRRDFDEVTEDDGEQEIGETTMRDTDEER